MAVLLFSPGGATLSTACEIGSEAQAASGPAEANTGTRVPGELITKARAHGVLRVIVQLLVTENTGEPAIEAVKQAVRTDISPTRHRVVRDLRGLPLLAIEASPETLRILNTSPHVVRVQEDTILRPQR